MSDSHGRRIDYVRMSVTDRCDLRCRYCMSDRMQFLPRRDLMTLEEIAQLADGFIARGVRRIRLTGGEPLVRRGIADLVRTIGARLGSGARGAYTYHEWHPPRAVRWLTIRERRAARKRQSRQPASGNVQSHHARGRPFGSPARDRRCHRRWNNNQDQHGRLGGRQ